MLLLFPTSYTVFIVASALFGMGFGGNLSSLGAIVAMHYPGGSLNFPFNFGITMLASAFGNLFVGVMEDVLDNSQCNKGNNLTACTASYQVRDDGMGGDQAPISKCTNTKCPLPNAQIPNAQMLTECTNAQMHKALSCSAAANVCLISATGGGEFVRQQNRNNCLFACLFWGCVLSVFVFGTQDQESFCLCVRCIVVVVVVVVVVVALTSSLLNGIEFAFALLHCRCTCLSIQCRQTTKNDRKDSVRGSTRQLKASSTRSATTLACKVASSCFSIRLPRSRTTATTLS